MISCQPLQTPDAGWECPGLSNTCSDHVVVWVLMVMYIFMERKGMLHTGRDNGDYGVAHCLGLFIVRAMSDGLK